MILFNKLIRLDLILVIGMVSLFFVGDGKWKPVLLGFVAALLVMSIMGHIRQYKLYKKFY